MKSRTKATGGAPTYLIWADLRDLRTRRQRDMAKWRMAQLLRRAIQYTKSS
jgi:hypothetical protein